MRGGHGPALALAAVLGVLVAGIGVETASEPQHANMTAACTISGTDGNDVIQGTPGDDVICGLKGDDVIYGGGGDDQISGGAGNDQLHGGDGTDRIWGNTGDDLIWGDSNPPGSTERLNGGPGNDTLYGGSGTDDLNGDTGVNQLWGGAGADYVDYSTRLDNVTATIGGKGSGVAPGDYDVIHTGIENLIGGYGSDTLTGDAGPNELNGGPGGDDVLRGLGGDDFLDGGCKGLTNPCTPTGDRDLLDGGAGYDIASYTRRADPLRLIVGGGAVSGDAQLGEADTISSSIEEVQAGAGNDTLVGNSAANVLDGNAGDDTISGLAGDDTLVGNDGNDTLDGGPGVDLIKASGDGGYVDQVTCDAQDTVRRDPEDVLTC